MAPRKCPLVVLKLTDLCLQALQPMLESLGNNYKWNLNMQGPLDNLAREIAESLMFKAYEEKSAWKPSMAIYLTPKIRTAIIPWDKRLWHFVAKKCKSLRQVLVATKEVLFDLDMFDMLPKRVQILDFSGKLVFRGKPPPKPKQSEVWLVHAEITKANHEVERGSIPLYLASEESHGLTELHLGEARISTRDIAHILSSVGHQLKRLHHYQQLAALYLLHSIDFKAHPSRLPVYKLANIDADFSHVVLCQGMKESRELSWDALKLALAVCADATEVRLRYDSCTPHHVIAPLASLHKMTSLSAVCVTSGERPLTDFQDFLPTINTHGSTLTNLEFKVVEEVDPHAILELCTRLECLTLSGCGYKAPPLTCPGPACPERPLCYLRTLFYADGDDFSWDHALPACFWKTILIPRGSSMLEGLYLESPRIPIEFWPKLKLPMLRTLSICRVPELTLEALESMAQSSKPNLQSIRISQCDKMSPRHGVRLRHALNIEVYVD